MACYGLECWSKIAVMSSRCHDYVVCSNSWQFRLWTLSLLTAHGALRTLSHVHSCTTHQSSQPEVQSAMSYCIGRAGTQGRPSRGLPRTACAAAAALCAVQGRCLLLKRCRVQGVGGLVLEVCEMGVQEVCERRGHNLEVCEMGVQVALCCILRAAKEASVELVLI
jgi:hypothetical protein